VPNFVQVSQSQSNWDWVEVSHKFPWLLKSVEVESKVVQVSQKIFSTDSHVYHSGAHTHNADSPIHGQHILIPTTVLCRVYGVHIYIYVLFFKYFSHFEINRYIFIFNISTILAHKAQKLGLNCWNCKYLLAKMFLWITLQLKLI
jgi:hypothetical protein